MNCTAGYSTTITLYNSDIGLRLIALYRISKFTHAKMKTYITLEKTNFTFWLLSVQLKKAAQLKNHN